MPTFHASSTGMSLGLVGFFGLLATFVGCSGSVSHTAAGCDYNGKKYAAGHKFPASDGCNQCSCGEGGDVECTLIGCEPGHGRDPTCEPVDAAKLCVRGRATVDGEVVEAGDPLRITVRSAGCLSSSCSKVIEASCTIGAGVAFEARANFCVADTSKSGQGCTDDCGTAHADCSFGQPLTAGSHQVKLGSIAVGFQVPSKLPLGGLCAGAP